MTGIELKEMRKRFNLTQEELAEELHLTRRSIAKLESLDDIPESRAQHLKLFFASKENGVKLTISNSRSYSQTKNGIVYEELPSGKFLIQSPVIPAKASAEYTMRLAEPEFIYNLPKAAFMVDRLGKENYRAFEIVNDSMNDGTINSIPNGCEMSRPSVNPKNWKSGGKSLLKRDWHIQYYFFDPKHKAKHPYGKLVIVKGMNHLKTIPQRRDATELLIRDEIDTLKSGFNPITKRFGAVNAIGELHPNLPIIEAFRKAANRKNCSESQKKQFRWLINRMEKQVAGLRLHRVTISQLKRVQLKSILDNMRMPDVMYNRSKEYLSSLFLELIEYDCADTNLARDIRKRKVTRKQREILTPKEMKKVMDHLHNNHYNFWRYANIFMFSGARSTELMNLKFKDVDVKSQEFKVTIKKGRSYKEVIKVIFGNVLHLWGELEGKSEDYVFSVGFAPGAKKIDPHLVSTYWRRWVKKELGVTADFYALKHSMLDSLPPEIARKIASHTSLKTTRIYQVNQDKRDREELKKLNFMKVV